MSKLQELLVSIVLPAFKEVAKTQFKDVLSKIQEHNTPEVYQNTLKSLNSSFLLLNDVAVKSKTKIDDAVIDVVLDAVQESAAEDSVDLSAAPSTDTTNQA